MANADTVIVCSLPLAKNAMHSPTSSYYPNRCRFLRVGWKLCAFAAFVRGRAWPAGSIEERPFFEQRPLKVHRDR